MTSPINNSFFQNQLPAGGLSEIAVHITCSHIIYLQIVAFMIYIPPLIISDLGTARMPPVRVW